MMKRWTRSVSVLVIFAVLLTITLLTIRPAPHSHPAAAGIIPHHFETGFVVPQWRLDGKKIALVAPSRQQGQLLAMVRATQSAWVEIPVVLDQPSSAVPAVRPGKMTLSVSQTRSLIDAAHRRHLKVFLLPLVLIRNQAFGGSVHYARPAQQQQWLQSLQKAWSPYLILAQQTGVNQVSLASELEGMAQAPTPLWDHYIAHGAQLYKGPLVIDINWSALPVNPPGWMTNPHLWAIGIFSYFPLESTPRPLSAAQIMKRDRTDIIRPVVQFSEKIHKPVLLSQVGYRDQSNALYRPFSHYLPGKPDPALQGAAYAAIAQAALAASPHIRGIFFWGWNVGIFSPGIPAQQVWSHLAPPRSP